MKPRVSPTALLSFEECPRRYRMTYVDRPRPPKPPIDAYRYVGVMAHAALAAWWESGNAVAYLADHWDPDVFADERQATRWYAKVSDWITRYTETLDRDEPPVGIERTVSFDDDSMIFSGRVDRVDERSGMLRIVDYKTGHRLLEPGAARASQPLALYAVAATRTLRRPCYRVELHHLPTGTVSVGVHDDESLARHLDRARNTAVDITAAVDSLSAGAAPDEVFPPQPGPLCGFCEHQARCPEGNQFPPADPHQLLDQYDQTHLEGIG